MKTTTVLIAIILAIVANAAPRRERLSMRDVSLMSKARDTTAVVNSRNTGGAVLFAPEGPTFSNIAGTIGVPPTSGSFETKEAIVYMAIDGYKSDTAVSAGYRMVVDVDGGVTYSAWCRWNPGEEIPISQDELAFTEGDRLSINIEILPGNMQARCTLAVVTTDLTGALKTGPASRDLFPSITNKSAIGDNAMWAIQKKQTGYPHLFHGPILITDASVIRNNDPITQPIRGAQTFELQNAEENPSIYPVIETNTTINDVDSSIKIRTLI
ncbi:Concanavalin A-like lectins/glucanase [Glarea lozoyensis ATCC 20868]|uniref:Concanavalin A-like lectins/glucanase n=1 Tax=Glarea lozoyensis (strain ATCC 20868 / MF5171) TaxID=1116229 RepID=S3CHK8_GLAL2|nr:Concanavalin A-like lectins/glucanase [Glarea lozoyensis ATCC 20868]EPE24764.1 Concanavalin A-like lectins/glucanase [Glarea lozoyensis ATCC 20868]